MIEYNRYSWWRTVFSFKGTALPRAAGRVALVAVFCVFVQAAYEAGSGLGWLGMDQFKGLDPSAHAVMGSLLGFLIVFRMNASNGRYWEGRSHWGQLINSSRNLVRVGVEFTDDGRELADLVTGYVICLRRSLQGSRDTLEADSYLSPDLCREAQRFGNIPTAVAAAITAWIGRHKRQGEFDPQLAWHMEYELGRLVDAQGGCEKIQKTPLPFAYVAMIKQLILVYLVTLPFVFCGQHGWWSPVLVSVIALGLFGMEEASVETEDPFGRDENCLDLEAYTLTIARDTGQLATLKTRVAAGAAPRSWCDSVES
ncbi:MAG: hypothetical protein EXS05_17540 [Planctomycetaceae bacterium]|nr:hypothetical protein [Planctomycetaceae bacterium]